jgi:hypothetical protein
LCFTPDRVEPEMKWKEGGSQSALNFFRGTYSPITFTITRLSRWPSNSA